jgi:NAD+ kinase
MVLWKRIAIAVKWRQPGAAPLLRRVLQTLNGRGIEVAVEAHGARLVPDLAPGPEPTLAEVLDGADGVIVLGGDGTTLAVVREIGARPIPVLGINLGNIGFLTDVHPDGIEEALEQLLSGACEIRERSRFEVLRIGASRAPDLILNDAVFTKGTALARMMELRTWVDGLQIATYRSDGLIVSTPTGSTAYSLSAGGPILEVDLRAMLLTPICPHTLSQRPIVLTDERAIEVEFCSGEDAILTLDGQVGEPLQPGDRTRISRSLHPARFVVVPDHNDFDTLRTKLGWGAR